MRPFFTLLTGIIMCFSANAQLKHRVVVANVLDLNGIVKNDFAKIEWRVSDNERGNIFEVEKSLDGITFETAGIVFVSDKAGMEEYEFKGIPQKETSAYYRLKIFNRDKSSAYSKVIQVKNNPVVAGTDIRVLNNYSASQLGFNYQSESKGAADVTIYSISGTRIYSGRVFAYTGSNMFTINTNGGIKSGVYILEVRNGKDRTAVKFVKG